MKDFRTLIVICTGLLLLGACVPVGIFYDDNFEDQLISFFDGRPVTREDVLFTFGIPDSTHVGDHYFVYRILSASFMFLLPSPGSGELRRAEWLLIEFDDDARVVAHYSAELVEGKDPPCFANGVCIATSNDGDVLVAEIAAVDAAQLIAGRDSETAESCAVYYFEDRDLLQGEVRLDDREFIPVPDDAYYVWTLPPGRHVLERIHYFLEDSRIAFECAADERHFYMLRIGRFSFSEGKRQARIERLDADAARAVLSDRRQVLN